MDEVASIGAEPAEGAPISLYIDLEKGQIADIEVVARAALAWSAAIKEIAFLLDPSIEIKVELASGTEGSLSLNSWIKKVRGQRSTRVDLWAIAAGAGLWILQATGTYTFDAVLDYLRGKDAPPEFQQLTENQLEQLASRIVSKIGENVARPQRQEIYRELERETAVKGVGVSLKPGTRPSHIVPRKDFPLASGNVIEESTGAKRRTTERKTVIVVSPTLKGIPRSWRFQYGTLPEFGAVMKDQAFLQAIEEGRISMPLRAGTEMEVELESKEEYEGGVWVAKERAIIRVYRPEISRSDELPLGGPFER